MELNNLNIDSLTATWFLLTLFYKTERKYTCTKEKIMQLLTIVALDYANNGDKIFNEEILRKDNGNSYIQGLMLLSGCEYIGADIQNDNKEYIDVNLNSTKDELVPLMYRCNIIDDELEEKITKVFRKFGAYPSTDLVNMTNPILDEITKEDKLVDLTRCDSILNEIEEENEVINYLKQSHLNNKNKNNKRLIKAK